MEWIRLVVNQIIYLWQASNIVEQGTVKQVLAQNLLMLTDQSFSHTHVIKFGGEVHAVLEKMEIRTTGELEVVGGNWTLFSFPACTGNERNLILQACYLLNINPFYPS